MELIKRDIENPLRMASLEGGWGTHGKRLEHWARFGQMRIRLVNGDMRAGHR
jgi:hypothetical protein